MLAPTSWIPAGGSANITGSALLRSRETNGKHFFAYATPQGILLRVETSCSTSGASANHFQYPISGSFGSAVESGGLGAPGVPISFDFNETFMAAIVRTAPPSTATHVPSPSMLSFVVRTWSITNGEVLPQRTPPSLARKWETEGAPYSLCVAGRHHLLIGTTAGKIVSLNTSKEVNEPNVVTVSSAIHPHPTTTTSAVPNSQLLGSSHLGASHSSSMWSSVFLSQSTGSPAPSSSSMEPAVLVVTASAVRSELVACGLSDGTLGVFLLDATTGLRQTHTVAPFSSVSSASAVGSGGGSMVLPPGSPGGISSASIYFSNAPSSERMTVTSLAFSPGADNYLAVGGTGKNGSGAVLLFSVDTGSVILQFSYPWKDISGLAWSAWEQGALYVSSTRSDVVRKYVVNHKQEVDILSPGVQSYPASMLTTFTTTTLVLGRSAAKRSARNTLGGGSRMLHRSSVIRDAGEEWDDGDGGEGEEGEGKGAGGERGRSGDPSRSGILGMACLKSQSLALALADGSIQVYHLPTQQTRLHTSPQHTRSVLSAALQKQDPQVFVTAGVDGVVSIWSAMQPFHPMHVLRLVGEPTASAPPRSGFAGEPFASGGVGQAPWWEEDLALLPPSYGGTRTRRWDPSAYGMGGGGPHSAAAGGTSSAALRITSVAWSTNSKQLRLYLGLHQGEVVEVNANASTLMWRRPVLAGTPVRFLRYLPGDGSSGSGGSASNRASSPRAPSMSFSSPSIPIIPIPGGGVNTNTSPSGVLGGPYGSGANSSSSGGGTSSTAVLLVAGGGVVGSELEDDEDPGVVVMLSKDGSTVLRTWSLPSGAAITALEVDAVHAKVILLGGGDHFVYVYPLLRDSGAGASMSSVGSSNSGFPPLLVLSAHAAPISSLAWNPLLPTVFASASEDGKICVWDLQSMDMTPSASSTVHPTRTFYHTTFGAASSTTTTAAAMAGGGGSVEHNLTPGEAAASSSHLSSSGISLVSGSATLPVSALAAAGSTSALVPRRVRALAWCGSLLPYLLLSGGDDAALCVWNAHPLAAPKKQFPTTSPAGPGTAGKQDDGQECLCRVRNGHAPLVAVLTHPDKPRRVTSVAADGTITHWGLTPLTQVGLDASLGVLEQRLEASSEALRQLASQPSSQQGYGKTPSQAPPPSASLPVSLFSLLPAAARVLQTTPAMQSLLQELRTLASSATSSSSTAGAGPGGAVGSGAKSPNMIALEKLQKLAPFFEDGSMGWKDILCYALYLVQPQAATSHTLLHTETFKQCVVFPPPTQLVEAHRATAQAFLEKSRGKTVSAIGGAYKKARLMESADRLWKAGLLEEAIQVWGDAGEWEMALSLAPALGKEFWSHWCRKVAMAMEREGRLDRAATYWIAAGESAKAAQVYARSTHSPEGAALVVSLACPQKNPSTANAPASTPAPTATMDGAVDTAGSGPVPQSLREDRVRALRALRSPLIDAALLLEEKKTDEAIVLLSNSGTHTLLAYLLLHTIPLQDQKSVEVVYANTIQHCCGNRQWEAALLCVSAMTLKQDAYATVVAAFQDACQDILQAQTPPGQDPSTSPGALSITSLQQLLLQLGNRITQECARLQASLDPNVIQQQHANDGLTSQLQLASMVIQGATAAASAAPAPGTSPSSTIFATSTPLLQSFNTFVESLFGVILQDVEGPHSSFYLRQALAVCRFVSLPHRRWNTPNAADPWVVEHRRFLSLSLFVSSLACVKLFRLPSLLNFVFSKASELGAGIASVENLIPRIHQCIGSYGPHVKDIGPFLSSGGDVLLLEATPTMPRESGNTGTGVHPSTAQSTHEDGQGKRSGGGGSRLVSFISGEAITGPVAPLVLYTPPATTATAASSSISTTPTTVYISREEAMQWSMINSFSPVLDGSRFYPASP